jgi:alpha-galactosidase
MDIETTDAGWTIRFGGNRYDLGFSNGALRNPYFGPDFAGPLAIVADHHQNFDQLRETRPEAAVFVGANRDRVLWDSAAAQRTADGLSLTLTSPQLSARLDFLCDDATGALRRRTTLTARETVELRGALSFSLMVGEPVRRVTYLTGAWAHDTQVRSIAPDFTSLLLESRSGKTGFEFQPYIALETATGVTVVELLWSGNWHIHARTRADDAIIAGGLPEGTSVRLGPGETLELPEAIIITAGDLNAATQKLHDLRRRLQVGDLGRIPVQFNSWYPFPGDPAVGDMKRLASTALELGAEVFVLDGGWHVNESDPVRDDPWQSTGDWHANPRLFPNGLRELSDHCHKIGIGFGIWFEPEGIGYSSGLRTRHPEWHHWINGRAPAADKRAILHLGVPEARAHVRDVMLRIIRDTGATWVKWDFNADLVSGGWPAGTPDALARKDPVLAHYEGLYQLQEELRAAVPDLVLEMCASGGGRFDGRILRHAHTNWMSDQANPLKNLSIHFGSQLAHPARFCNDWLIAWPPAEHVRHGGSNPDLRGDLKFRLRGAMLGTFGLSSRLELWSADEIATAREHIAWYKDKARDVIAAGDQYLLTEAPPLNGEGDWAAAWYAAKDSSRGVGYFFRLEGERAERTFALDGLDPDATYEIVFHDGESQRRSGSELARGLAVRIAQAFGSAAVSATRVETPA